MSERRIQSMCLEGIIPGVKKFGHSWAIPDDAEKPIDHRIKTGQLLIEKVNAMED